MSQRAETTTENNSWQSNVPCVYSFCFGKWCAITATLLLSIYMRQRHNPAVAATDPMNKLSLTLLLVFALILVGFGTWQLFAGNLKAAFSTFPFLLIMYLFLLKLRR